MSVERLSFRIEDMTALTGGGTVKAIRSFPDEYGRYVTIHDYRAMKRAHAAIEKRLAEAEDVIRGNLEEIREWPECNAHRIERECRDFLATAQRKGGEDV